MSFSLIGVIIATLVFRRTPSVLVIMYSGRRGEREWEREWERGCVERERE